MTQLRAQLGEAEETLRAIREGEVDAIVVSGSQGDQVFSLTGAESVYRLIVETMKEAALTVTTDGRILFCNSQFGAFVQTPPERILGRPLAAFVAPDSRAVVASLLARSQEASVKRRLVFQGPEGPPLPAHVSAMALRQADSLSICLVATDLTELEASTELLRLLQREQAALRASETEFRAFFDTAAVGATELNLDGRFVRVNDRYCELTGFSREELLGMTPADLAPPEDRAVDQARVAAQLRESSTVFEVEKRYVRKDGRVNWVRVSAAPIRDAAGRPLRSAGVIQDITERKRAEEQLRQSAVDLAAANAELAVSLREKELLLQEVHHRVKNNLQLISSLIGLQDDALADPAMHERLAGLRHQVHAMALVHEKLYGTEDLGRVEFAGYARDLLDDLWRAHGAPAARAVLRLDLEPVALPVTMALPCGLILNELVRNALKHAFCGRGGGEVTVSLRRDATGQVRLRVTDNGVGLPAGLDWRQAQSLGLRLVRALAGQLRGTVEVRTAGGTECAVAFPAPAGVEDVTVLSAVPNGIGRDAAPAPHRREQP